MSSSLCYILFIFYISKSVVSYFIDFRARSLDWEWNNDEYTFIYFLKPGLDEKYPLQDVIWFSAYGKKSKSFIIGHFTFFSFFNASKYLPGVENLNYIFDF